MSEPVAIDSGMMGERGLQSPWVIPAERPVVIDPGPANRAGEVDRAIRELGVDRLAGVVLTHIHFDHAGGAAELARLNPGARIFVHPRVAALVVDPTPLNQAVASVWGPATGELFGFPSPAPEGSVEAIGDEGKIDLGGGRELVVLETPGHTRAHLAFFDRHSDAVFCGDAVAIQVEGSNAVRPSTPPSDYDRDSMERSMEKIRATGASRLLLPHFGEAAGDLGSTIDISIEALARWHDAFEALGPGPEAAERLVESAEGGLDPSIRERFERINPAWLNLEGLELERDRLAGSAG